MKLSQHREFIIAVLIAIGTFLTFQPILTHDFLNIDDHIYVSNNAFVQKGISIESVKWAFTTLHAEFYHPFTWLSLMLDTHLYGVNPAGYLFSNLLLHILNTILLFTILLKLTRMPVQSTFVAMLFAIHPLHIESVAWIAERKDVLSTLFWMLTIWCYITYVKNPKTSRFILIHLVYLIGLLAKPMLVTLPIILLILDFWPLRRYQSEPHDAENSIGKFIWMVKEKLILFILSAGAGIMTIIAQYKGGGLDVMQDLSLGDRVSNALVSILVYIFRTIWPENLSVFYPFPLETPLLHVLGSMAYIVVITLLCIHFRNKYPYLIVGWLWYVVTLLPVLGILKVGGFATADRYTYIPLIGLFIVLSWGISDLLRKSQYRKPLSAGLIGMIILGLFLKTTVQLQNWSNSYFLFTHAAKVTQGNDFAYHSLGHIFAANGDFDEAVAQFQKALQINPNRNITQKDLARLLAYQGKLKQSEKYLKQLLEDQPDYGASHYIFGIVLVMQNRFEEALIHLTKGFRQHPRYQAISRIRHASDEVRRLYAQGQQDAAAGHLNKARIVFDHILELDRHYHPARMSLADVMISEKCDNCALKLYLDQLSDTYLKELLAAGYQKWPVFSNAKEDTI